MKGTKIVKRFLSIFLFVILAAALSSCSDDNAFKKISDVKDLQGKKIASLTGGVFQETLEKAAPDVKMTHLFFNDNALNVRALLSGKVDGVLLDEPMAQLWCALYPNELYIGTIYADDCYSFAIKKKSPLTPKINKIITELEKSGELAEFKKKWCQSTDPNRKITKWTHNKNYDGSAGVIRYATDPSQEPMVYLVNNEYGGMEIEVLNRIAYELNMKLVITSMNFGALIEVLQANKADLVGGSMSVTPSRLEKVDFVTSYYKGGQAVLARLPMQQSSETVIEKITDLANRKVGVRAAGTLPLLAKKFVSDVNYVYFTNYTDAVQALLINKIDAILMDEPIAANFVGKHPDDLKIASIFVDDEYGFALSKKSPLLLRASEVITKMEKSGDLAKLKAKWCGSDESKKVLEDWKKSVPFSGKNGTLRFSAPPRDEPLCYMSGKNEVIGYEMDVANRIAAELDMDLQFISIDSGARMETIVSGKADISGGSMSITPERKEKVAFLPSHYKGGVAILVRKNVVKSADNVPFAVKIKNFAGEIKASFDPIKKQILQIRKKY